MMQATETTMADHYYMQLAEKLAVLQVSFVFTTYQCLCLNWFAD